MRRLAFLILVLSCGGPRAAEIKTIRTWTESPRTLLVFDVTDRVDYAVFTMRNPDRIVVDFKRTRPQQPLALPAARNENLKGLRHARRGDDGLRVVIDLEHEVAVSDTLLEPDGSYGYRVLLDFGQPGRAAPSRKPASRPEVLAGSPSSRPRPVAVAPSAPVKTAVAARAPAPAAPPPPVIAAKPATGAPLRDVVVAIDPGHGGEDVGAIGPTGVYEKDVTLAVARELATLINATAGMRAVLTRDNDRYLKLRDRMDRARQHRADLFISVHADAFTDRRVQGSSVYVLSQRGASSEAAKWLAENENAADLIGGVSLDDKDAVLKSVLLDLSQTASIEASIDLGNHVLAALKRLGPVHKKQVQHAGFMVLKSPDIPSILVETAFISNHNEEKRLRSQPFRRQLAKAILGGIGDYFENNPAPGTRIAENRSHRVARGDTLSGIADRYAVSVTSIKFANNLSSEQVRAGEVLKIP